jgi:(p)ppGpp synthase/HD superfamily hydrolase
MPMTRRYGDRFADALSFASQKHDGQIRKGSGAPYISHPIAVASLVADYGGDEDQAIAALLHDTMEDCGVEEDELRQRFGQRVSNIVRACTDTTEQPKPPWKARKVAHIAKVSKLGSEVKLVVAADKLHNATSIARDLARPSVGTEVWERFRAPKPEVRWYYRAMLEALASGWQNEILNELHATIATIESD